MDIRQKVEQKQKPVLNQSFIQIARILELSLPELNDVVETELEENPALEGEVVLLPVEKPAEEAPASADEADDPNAEREALPPELAGYEKPIPNKKESLRDLLARQLRINANDEDIPCGMSLIMQIDENGYLRTDLDEIAKETACAREEILRILRMIQTFDPAGVGARDLKECLLLQLERLKEDDAILRQLIENHLEDIARAAWPKLLKKLKCTEEELKIRILKLHRLEPKPGRSYSSEDTRYVIPDASIEAKGDGFLITSRDETLPVLRINPLYRGMLRDKKVDPATKDYIRQKITNGNNLIRAIHNRRQLLLQILELITDIQKEALGEGLDKLKPLALKETAEKIGIHESTISRIVSNKYVQTPIGILRLRQFFSSGLKNTDGVDISTQSARFKIRELIESEDKDRPLKDREIVLLLKQTHQIDIARRTVVKYRTMLKIPSAPERRRAEAIAQKTWQMNGQTQRRSGIPREVPSLKAAGAFPPRHLGRTR